MQRRMQGLHAPVQHFRKARPLRDLHNGDAGRGQLPGRAAGGEDFDAALREKAPERLQPRLVGHGNKGAANGYAVAGGHGAALRLHASPPRIAPVRPAVTQRQCRARPYRSAAPVAARRPTLRLTTKRRIGSGGRSAARGSDSTTRSSSLSSPQICSASSLPPMAPLVMGATSQDMSAQSPSRTGPKIAPSLRVKPSMPPQVPANPMSPRSGQRAAMLRRWMSATRSISAGGNRFSRA